MDVERILLTAWQQEVLELLEELVAWTRTALHGVPLPPNEADAVLILMAGAQYRRAHALACQVRGGSSEGARLLARSMMELFINARYIVADKSLERVRAAAFSIDGIITRKRWAQDHRDVLLATPEDVDQAAVKYAEDAIRHRDDEISNAVKEYGPDVLRLPKLSQRAEEGGVLDVYRYGYALFSQSVHGTPADLERFVRDPKSPKMLDLRPDVEFLDVILERAFLYLVMMLGTCNERLHIFKSVELDRFDEPARRLMAESADEAKAEDMMD